MEEQKFVNVRKDEYNLKQFVKKTFGKGKVSRVKIEYTPVGEKIIISTHRPGLIIGKSGESIAKLTEVLKKSFKMENPHVDINEIKYPEFDAQIIADEIALLLERFGSMRFKSISYKMLMRIKKAGALGCEIKTSGKLPSDRAKSWRFAFGYLKKTGDCSKVVDRAMSVAETKQGVIGIKVAILAPDAKIHDKIELNEDLLNQIKRNAAFTEEVVVVKKSKKKKIIK
ncbi:MAG: 30S ribosomal protein S3 [Nanoarchaeota archaeon]|nr:30S ribosomal protein S3 [Nanoarchaeota archaeon]